MTIEYINATRPEEIFPYLTTITGGYFGTFLLLIIFLTGLIVLGGLKFEKALIASSFFTAIMATLLFLLDSVSVAVLIVSTLILCLAVIVNQGRG